MDPLPSFPYYHFLVMGNPVRVIRKWSHSQDSAAPLQRLSHAETKSCDQEPQWNRSFIESGELDVYIYVQYILLFLYFYFTSPY